LLQGREPKKIELRPAVNLHESPDNPAPPGAVVTPVVTGDGYTLRAVHWAAISNRPRGTILLLHGRAEFIEKYFEVIGELLDRGFAVVTFDWRGQGSSGRALPDQRKGHVRHFADFRHDVEAVWNALVDPLCPKPVACIAHSMGGCIALAGVVEGWLKVERLVATTPMIALSLVKHARLARGLARLLGRLGLSERFVPGGKVESVSTEPFPGNRLSGDERRYARNAALARALGAGAIGSPTIGWLSAAYDAMEIVQAPGFASRIKVPTLVIAAGDDPVCSTPAVELFAGGLGPGSTHVTIPGSRHEVMMESDEVRSAFWQAFDAFMPGPHSAQLGPASTPQEVEHALVEALVPAGDDGTPAGRGAAVP
jgi:lysophospholipase